MMKRKKKEKGVNVTVSPKAHRKMWNEALKSKPPRDLREHVNVINNLPIEA